MEFTVGFKAVVVEAIEKLRTKVEAGIATPTEVKRLVNAEVILSDERDCGRWGKAAEVLMVSDTARKVAVARQGKIDGYFNFEGKRKAVEYKTNGGRIGALYRLRKPEKAFIIYAMDFETRQTFRKDGTPRPTKHYVVPAVILKVSDFLAILEHCNATKVIGHKGKGDDEIAIQGDSVKLAKCLLQYPIVFDALEDYTEADFENLILW